MGAKCHNVQNKASPGPIAPTPHATRQSTSGSWKQFFRPLGNYDVWVTYRDHGKQNRKSYLGSRVFKIWRVLKAVALRFGCTGVSLKTWLCRDVCFAEQIYHIRIYNHLTLVCNCFGHSFPGSSSSLDQQGERQESTTTKLTGYP